MDKAVEVVPLAQQATTSVCLRATAGLRLLPGGKADAILKEVSDFLRTYKFLVKDDAVSILDGKDEGAYAWLTLNYLLGKLGGEVDATVASVDLGGGSVQEAFAVTDSQAKASANGYIVQLKGAGKTYNVYVHSYLGYGLMAARAKVIDAALEAKSHPCFAKDQDVSYKYVDLTYTVKAEHMTAAGKFDTCANVSIQTMNFSSPCGAVQLECSFSGAWRGKGPGSSRSYYISSYFWDRALDAGIITDAAAIEWPTSPKAFGAKAESVCGLGSEDIASKFPSVKAEQQPFLCLDLAYCHSLLTQGFRISDDAHVTLVKQVKYNGQAIEAAWTLGAAVNTL